MARPAISVIIPNWNGVAHLPVCLNSLRRQSFSSFEVLVVDNGSRDGSAELVAHNFPEVQLLALTRNLGFAGGVNAGIRAARGQIIALLNNDTEAHPQWLAEMYDTFERYPEAGMIACKILLFDRRDTLHSAGDIYQTNGMPGNRGVWEADDRFNFEMAVFSPCGAAAGYRRQMLDDVGLFDEDFFAFCEDVDLGWRGQVAGWPCIYTPKSVVYHKLSATGGGVIASFYSGRNCIGVIAKDYPSPLLNKYWRQVIAAQLHIAADAIRAWRGAAARARLRGQIAGILRLPKTLKQRAGIQAKRRVSIDYLESIMTKID